MTVSELLKGISDCPCGRRHDCNIKHVISGRDALSSLENILSDYSGILLVADENTYRAAGEKTESMLSSKTVDRMIFDGTPLLVPNESAIEKIEKKITPGVDMIVGIGSGVINDLCKYTSFKANLPYCIVATAPSMDGYASVGSALILDGMKVTPPCAVPFAIIADSDVLANAPMDMIIAGYGDIMGKYSSLTDWKLGALVNGEYICNRVLDETYKILEKTHSLAERIKARDAEAVSTLTEALISVGILIAYVSNSRPASGSEHHLSHYFEITGIVHKQKYLPHGTDVFYSAAETAKIREELLHMDTPTSREYKFDKSNYDRDIKALYGKIASEVEALQDKLGFYPDGNRRLSVYGDKWQEIKDILCSAPTFEKMSAMLEEVGMKYEDFIKYYGREKIDSGIKYAKDLKDRYTVLWMYYDLFEA